MAHTANHASHTEAESHDSCDTRRQFAWLIVVRRVVASKSTLVEEVVGERDALVNGKPITDEVHEVIQHGLEVGVAWDGDCDIHTGGDACPDEAGHLSRPAGKHHDGQGHGVDVRAVVGDDAESKHHETEFAEVAERREEDGSEETTGAASGVTSCIDVIAAVDVSCGHNRYAKHLSEEKRNDQAKPGPEEHLAAGLVRWLVNGVVGCVGSPAGCESVNHRSERENAAKLGSANFPWDVLEVAAVRKNAQNDEEDDGSRYPAPEFVGVHNLIPKQCHQERAHCDDNNSSIPWNVIVHSIEQLRTDNGVDGRPANACQHIEDGNELHTPPAEPEAREHHLAQAKRRAEGREVADRHDAEQVEEKDH